MTSAHWTTKNDPVRAQVARRSAGRGAVLSAAAPTSFGGQRHFRLQDLYVQLGTAPLRSSTVGLTLIAMRIVRSKRAAS